MKVYDILDKSFRNETPEEANLREAARQDGVDTGTYLRARAALQLGDPAALRLAGVEAPMPEPSTTAIALGQAALDCRPDIDAHRALI